MRIVVNADDFGRSNSRNSAIAMAIEKSWCTQTSLMVNLPDTDEAVNIAKENGFSDRVGLHINLTLGEPLTSTIKRINLYCHDKKFRSRGYNNSRRLVLPIYIDAIRQELEAQINKYLQYGFTLMHIDSHNWVHLSVPVWLALKPLLKQYNFKSIRTIRPGLLIEGSFKRNAYYKLYKRYMLNARCINILPYASNIEQFIQNENFIIKKYEHAEIFTHPDLIKGILMDASYSYTGEPMQTLENNIGKISKHEKVSYREIHKELGI